VPSSGAAAPYALRAQAPGEVAQDTAKIRGVYNIGIPLHVTEPVTLVSARALSVPTGVTQLPALAGYLCGKEKSIPYLVESRDLNRRGHGDVRPLPGAALDAARNGTCWYVVLRFTPTQRGRFVMTRGEVVYRVGTDTRTAEFDFTTTLTVP
jgi:hypothetical protein